MSLHITIGNLYIKQFQTLILKSKNIHENNSNKSNKFI